MESPGLSGSQAFGEDALQYVQDGDPDSPGHVERSRFLEEYSQHRPLSAGMRPRLLNKVAHAAMGYGVTGDDSEGDGDTDPWTLDGWGDEPSVPEKARQASTKLLSKWARNIPCTLPTTNAPGRRIMSAGPHRSPQPTSGARGPRAQRTGAGGAGPDGVPSPSKVGARRTLYVPTVRRAVKPLADLEVGDESDIEPEELAAAAVARRAPATVQAAAVAAAAAARRTGRAVGPTGGGSGAGGSTGPAQSMFSAASVMAAARESNGSGIAGLHALRQGGARHGAALCRQDSNSSAGTYDGEVASDASISRISSARQATATASWAGASAEGGLSPGGLRVLARPLIPQTSSPRKQVGAVQQGAGQLQQQMALGQGLGPPPDEGYGRWSPCRDSPRSGGSTARNMSAAAAAASQVASQQAVAAAAAQQAAALESATAAARTAVKAKLQQDLETLMARRTALHKQQSGTTTPLYTNTQQPQSFSPAAPTDGSPSLCVGPSPGRLRRVSSTGAAAGSTGSTGGLLGGTGAVQLQGQAQPGLGVGIMGVAVGPPPSMAQSMSGSGATGAGSGAAGVAARSRGRQQPNPQGSVGVSGAVQSRSQVQGPPVYHSATSSASARAAATMGAVFIKPATGGLLVEGGGISAWDSDRDSTPGSMSHGYRGHVDAHMGGSEFAQWPPPRPAPAADPHRAAVDNVFRGAAGQQGAAGSRLGVPPAQSPGSTSCPSSHTSAGVRRTNLASSGLGPGAAGAAGGELCVGVGGTGGGGGGGDSRAMLRRVGSENAAGGRPGGSPIPVKQLEVRPLEVKQFSVDGGGDGVRVGSRSGAGAGPAPPAVPPAGMQRQRSFR